MKIGNITLAHGLIAAPMAGISDRSFRILCREMGAEYTVSEMVCAKALVYEQLIKKTDRELYKTAALAAVSESDLPMGLQIFGSEPEFMAQATELIVKNSYKGTRSTAMPTAIDINMGCPVHKIVSNGEGSALMKDPELCGRIVEAVVGAANGIPVTVKIRAGFDAEHRNAVEVAKTVEAAGASLVAVHGRTRTQMYGGSSDNGIIAEVKAALKIPVVGNGDITDAASAIKMKNETGCDGLMIGRAAIGDPFIFAEIAAALEGRNYIRPTRGEIIETAIRQTRMMAEEKGERVGVAEARKHLCKYLHGFSGAAEARGRINFAETVEDVEGILREFSD